MIESEKQSIEIGLLAVVPQGSVNIEHDWQTVPIELPVTDRDQTALAIGNYVLDKLAEKGLIVIGKPKGEDK